MQVDAEFEDAAEAYVRPFLLRGIPSLFSDLKTLYRCAPKHLGRFGSMLPGKTDPIKVIIQVQEGPRTACTLDPVPS